MKPVRLLLCALAAVAALGAGRPAAAETPTVVLARLPGLPHLPMMIMQQQHLVEQHLAQEGLSSTKVTWLTMNGAAQTDALISGQVNITSAGVTNLAVIWAATGGKVKAIAAEDAVPNYLITSNPKVKTIADFTSADRIAVPSVLVSPQAIMLKMASLKAFGVSTKLDALTVAMQPADATLALLSGSGTVDSHFSIPPYQQQEMADPKLHVVTSSYDIMGGPATVVVVSTTAAFYKNNPKTIQAVLGALDDAMAMIKNNPDEAAKIYLEASHDTKTPQASITAILKDPDMIYSRTPQNITKFVDFMYQIGQIHRQPKAWTDLFFPAGQLPGGS